MEQELEAESEQELEAESDPGAPLQIWFTRNNAGIFRLDERELATRTLQARWRYRQFPKFRENLSIVARAYNLDKWVVREIMRAYFLNGIKPPNDYQPSLALPLVALQYRNININSDL